MGKERKKKMFPSRMFVIKEGRGKEKNKIVNTRFCTYDLIKKYDWNDHPCTPKILLYYMH